MSADIVNLRQARKRKARADREKTADDNRIKFGRSKSENSASKRVRSDLAKKIDGHRRSPDERSDVPTGSS